MNGVSGDGGGGTHEDLYLRRGLRDGRECILLRYYLAVRVITQPRCRRIQMKQRTLIALSIAAAFAFPLAAQAAGDKDKSATSGDKSAAAGASSSGAEKMFQALD